MTNDQAIAYLAEMDREINVLLQARRAGQQISEILQLYKKCTAELELMETNKKNIEDAISSLEKVHETERAKIEAQLENVRKDATIETTELTSRMATLRKDAKDLENTVRDKQAFFEARSAQMDTEINDKAETLRKLEAGIHEFKQKHGLA